MPIYQFVARSVQSQEYPEVRWMHLADNPAAFQIANLLVQQFKASGRYPASIKSWLDVVDQDGRTILSIPF